MPVTSNGIIAKWTAGDYPIAGDGAWSAMGVCESHPDYSIWSDRILEPLSRALDMSCDYSGERSQHAREGQRKFSVKGHYQISFSIQD